MKKLVLGLLSAGLVAAPLVASQYSFASGGPPHTSSSAHASVGATQAETTAVNAVGGGQVTHISNDTYQGQAVYDVHVLCKGTLYDVKVSRSSGAVVQKKLSSEQPQSPPSGANSSGATSGSVNSTQAEQLAVSAVGGGSVLHISADHYQGQGVWDVHVQDQGKIWDIKISQGTGSVLEKKLASEPNAGSPGKSSSDSQDQPDHHGSPTPPPSAGSVPYGQKLSSVPSAYQSTVNQALQQENGRLKWVKFIHKHHGETQMNIKIRRIQGGTVKVKDLFNASGQLVQEKVNH